MHDEGSERVALLVEVLVVITTVIFWEQMCEDVEVRCWTIKSFAHQMRKEVPTCCCAEGNHTT